MQKEQPVKTTDLENKTPFSDFEVTLSTSQTNNQEKSAKGRFLLWGDILSNDCPA
ncbi:MAG: hypothetical protein HWE30_08490 [Methylocystaceae bacterium]|nr:hypothetical protein [Methylocystaceae bacterium]